MIYSMYISDENTELDKMLRQVSHPSLQYHTKKGILCFVTILGVARHMTVAMVN